MSGLNALANRAALLETARGFTLEVAAERSAMALLFLAAWLLGWGYGGRVVLAELSAVAGQDAMETTVLAVWLVGWAGGLAVALWSLLWLLTGVERVDIDADGIAIRRQVFGVGRTRRYAAAGLRAMRPAARQTGPALPRQRGRRRSPPASGIAVDSAGATVYFARGVGSAEAERIIDRVGRRFAGYVESAV